jgi:hypothetical protein
MLVFVLIVIAAGAVLARSLMNKSNSTADRTEEAFVVGQPESDLDLPSPAPAVEVAEAPAVSENEIEAPVVVDETQKDEAPDKTAPSIWGPELDSIAALNQAAAGVDAVFIFLAAEGELDIQPITKEIDAAARKIQSGGSSISAFTLKKGSTNYMQMAKQFSVPCVVAMVRGRGMSAVSGEITESKLLQAFVAASRPSSGCAPGACAPGGTCGPPAKPGTK